MNGNETGTTVIEEGAKTRRLKKETPNDKNGNKRPTVHGRGPGL